MSWESLCMRERERTTGFWGMDQGKWKIREKWMITQDYEYNEK